MKKKTVVKKHNTKAVAIVERLPEPIMQGDLTGIGNVNPQQLIITALERNVPMEVLQKLLDMRERLQKEEAERFFRGSMSNFQAECPIIKKTKVVMNKDGKSTRYKYAPIDSIVRQVQVLLDKHGLSFNSKTSIISDPFPGISATVQISHIMGHSEYSSFEVPMDKDAYMTEPQKWSSAATFAKRIAFCNGFGIITGDEDDDAAITGEDSEGNKEFLEMLAKLNALPEKIKDGFKILGYTKDTQLKICIVDGFDPEKISTRINKIIDKQADK